MHAATIFTVIGIAIAAFAAGAAAWSAWLMRKTAEAQLLATFLARYGSMEMLETLEDLGPLRGTPSDELITTYQQLRVGTTETNVMRWRARNLHRRELSSFYLEAIRMQQSRYVTSQFVRTLAELPAYAVLIEVVEPIEYAHNPDYPRARFDAIVRVCGLPDGVSRFMPPS